MIIKLTLSLPEHNTLIEGYHELFSEDVTYEINWDCAAIPGVGDFIDGAMINPLLADKVNNRITCRPNGMSRTGYGSRKGK